jgi:outer membrane protein assembly factor BamD
MKSFWICLVVIVFLLGCASKSKMAPRNAEDQFGIAKDKYQKKKYDEAVTEFYKVIFSYPGASFIDSAQLYLGMCYYRQEDYSLAIAEFKKLLSSFPTSRLADEAEYFIPLCNYCMSLKAPLDQEDTKLAIEGFADFLDYYPDSPYAPRAKRYLLEARSKLAEKTYKNGILYIKLNECPAALIYFNEVLDKYGDTKWAGKSIFRIAEVYEKQGERTKALEKYKELVQNHPQEELVKEAQNKIEKLEGKS